MTWAVNDFEVSHAWNSSAKGAKKKQIPFWNDKNKKRQRQTATTGILTLRVGMTQTKKDSLAA